MAVETGSCGTHVLGGRVAPTNSVESKSSSAHAFDTRICGGAGAEFAGEVAGLAISDCIHEEL